MGWLGRRRRKKEEKEPENAEVEARNSAPTGPDLLVLVPEIAGAPTFQVNRFSAADDAVAFIKTSVPQELLPSVHIFWALHEGPPPDVGPVGGEALVLIRAGDGREAVHVVSFVDLESAESFARFEVKRGLDVAFVIIYWAAFSQVIETPFGLRLDPPSPPDARQWRAAAIAASHAAPAATPIRRQSAAMQAGDDYGPELRAVAEAKRPDAPLMAAPRATPAPTQAYSEATEPPAATREPDPAFSPEPFEPMAESAAAEAIEPAFDEVAVEEPEAQIVEESPQEPATPTEGASEDTPATSEPAEQIVVLEAPAEDREVEKIAQSREAQPIPDPDHGDARDAEEVVVPPEFIAEPEAPGPGAEPALAEPALNEGPVEEPEAQSVEESPREPATPMEAAREDTPATSEPAEQIVVHLGAPAEGREVKEITATEEAQPTPDPDHGDARDAEEVVVPPEFVAEPAAAAEAIEPAFDEVAVEEPEAQSVDESPQEPASAVDGAREDTPATSELAEQIVVHPEAPADDREVEEIAASGEARPTPDPDHGDAQGVVVPPEFVAEPEVVAASTNGHHADEPVPDELRVEGPVFSTEGDEEVAERLLTEALGAGARAKDAAARVEAERQEPSLAELVQRIEAMEVSEPVPEDTQPIEEPEEQQPQKRKKAKTKSGSRRKQSRGDDDEEQELIPVDVNEVVEKTLRVKRWTKQDEPFKGFDSPPGRF